MKFFGRVLFVCLFVNFKKREAFNLFKLHYIEIQEKNHEVIEIKEA